MASYMDIMPTEILLHIFSYLPAKSFIRCRAVNQRWNCIIYDLTKNEKLWHQYCKDDFTEVYMTARKKAKPNLHWYNLYRSLTLWKLFSKAKEKRQDCAVSTRSSQEIRNFETLRHGTIGVLKKGSIVYYDIENITHHIRQPIFGDYSKYKENDHVIILIKYNVDLYILRKVLLDSFDVQKYVSFENITLFTLTDNNLYFVNFKDEIFVCNLHSRRISANYMTHTEYRIMSIGYSGGHLNVLTSEREIFTIVDNHLVPKYVIGPDSNLLHQFKKYNFLEHIDWQVYFQWMYLLNQTIPNGPLRDIIIIRTYGDVYFVGSSYGVLRIYYAPYSAGELDIFNAKPIKQYNFMEKAHCPILCICPILQVDVIEVNNGHDVIVAMPSKLVVLHFTHNFKTETIETLQAGIYNSSSTTCNLY